ncbi:septum formation initiator [Streptomyces sp. J2-1]|uniref:septum site-determining protein Ssd n=1 Tax=Streptomyces corallincola TaxID=2851888 RepID=UPI001C380371|nr:septum site-determining protein Ssd [Streptomyces corallincola]MBV2357853.1 septum formation initiator [Streptomyces corallincola]
MTGTVAQEPQSAANGRPGRPLILTEDAVLLDDLLRLCAAAGATPEVRPRLPDQGGGWEAAPLVLVGDDAAHRVRGAARRRGVVLVGRDQDDPEVWQRAVRIGADHVLMLPDGEQWLVDRIADVVEGVGRPALTVGVIGGRGGAGASTLACALAVTAARHGTRTLLVDADPLGGGLDVLLGGESTEGLRWPAFAASRGRVGGGALEESLPRLHALRVLSWDRGDCVAVPPQAVRAVLAAARRRGGAVVVDLPRRLDEGVAEVLAQLDLAVLVVTGDLRAVAAAGRVASVVGMVVRDLRVAVRGPYAPGLDEREVARLLRLPLAGEVPVEPGLLRPRGTPKAPAASGRGPLSRFCAGFWEQALVESGGAR